MYVLSVYTYTLVFLYIVFVPPHAAAASSHPARHRDRQGTRPTLTDTTATTPGRQSTVDTPGTTRTRNAYDTRQLRTLATAPDTTQRVRHTRVSLRSRLPSILSTILMHTPHAYCTRDTVTTGDSPPPRTRLPLSHFVLRPERPRHNVTLRRECTWHTHSPPRDTALAVVRPTCCLSTDSNANRDHRPARPR
jgi:hypothetical protein